MLNPTDTTAHWKILQKISTVKLNISPYSIQFSKSRESERERKWGYTSTATPTVKSSLHRCKFPGNLSPATFLLFAPQNRALHVFLFIEYQNFLTQSPSIPCFQRIAIRNAREFMASVWGWRHSVRFVTISFVKCLFRMFRELNSKRLVVKSHVVGIKASRDRYLVSVKRFRSLGRSVDGEERNDAGFSWAEIV